MEIKLTQRQITIDSLDILALEEETALGKASEEDQEQIRQDFAARRAALQEPLNLSFTLAPPDFVNQMKSLEFAQEQGLWDGASPLRPFVTTILALLYRITDWSGFEADGKPLPCTPENKVLVFGQAFHVIQTLQWKLGLEEAAEAKNSGTSAAG